MKNTQIIEIYQILIIISISCQTSQIYDFIIFIIEKLKIQLAKELFAQGVIN